MDEQGSDRGTGGMNLHGFVRNSPVVWVDSNGMWVLDPVNPGNGVSPIVISPPPYELPRLPEPGENPTIGIGGGLGGAAEMSWSSGTCCEGKRLYKYAVFTICGGLGLEASVVPGVRLPLPGVTDPGSGYAVGNRKPGECPPLTLSYFKTALKTPVGEGGGYVTAPGAGAGPILQPGLGASIGFSWVWCSDTRLRFTDIGCCEQ